MSVEINRTDAPSTVYLFEGVYQLRQDSGATPAQCQAIMNRFNVFLEEAERILKGRLYGEPRALTPEEEAHLRSLIARDKYVEAIRDVRRVMDIPLKEAKDIVDRLREKT